MKSRQSEARQAAYTGGCTCTSSCLAPHNYETYSCSALFPNHSNQQGSFVFSSLVTGALLLDGILPFLNSVQRAREDNSCEVSHSPFHNVFHGSFPSDSRGVCRPKNAGCKKTIKDGSAAARRARVLVASRRKICCQTSNVSFVGKYCVPLFPCVQSVSLFMAIGGSLTRRLMPGYLTIKSLMPEHDE